MPKAKWIGRITGAKQGEELRLDSQKRWGLIYSAILLYILLDSILSLILSFGGTIITAISLAAGGDCEVPTYLPSLLTFITRLLDFCCATCDVCCRPFTNGVPGHAQFRRIVKRNFYITLFQGACSIAQISLGILALNPPGSSAFSGFEDCGSSGISAIVFGVLLFLNVVEELVVWTYCYLFMRVAETQEVPDWVDDFIPSFMMKYAMGRVTRGQQQS